MRRRELRLTRALAVALAAVCAGTAPAARAQSCAPADVRFTLPIDGAPVVPLDATLRAYYGVGASYAAESVLVGSSAGRESIVGDFDGATGVLSEIGRAHV